MKLETTQAKVIKWFARISALLILLIGLPFYFGYGNPLPFINPEYTFAENAGLIVFPIIFVGLVLGWKYEKLGGYLVSAPLMLGFILSLIAKTSFPINILIALIPGLLYLAVGYNKVNDIN